MNDTNFEKSVMSGIRFLYMSRFGCVQLASFAPNRTATRGFAIMIKFAHMPLELSG